GDRAGAGLRVLSRDLHRIEVRADHAARLRCFLDFRDDRPSRRGQRGAETAAWIVIELCIGERFERPLTAVLGDLLAVGAYNVVEDHAGAAPRCVSSITRSSVARARPLSSASRAAAIPASSAGARSAV